MQQLITQNDISVFARPCNCEEDLAKRCINEAQMLDIKNALGDNLYLRLFKIDPDIDFLLSGGEYKDVCGNIRVFAGLKTALCYYAYARIVRAGSGRQTRYGYVEKSGDYSQNADIKMRMQAYNEAFAIADGFMSEVLIYLHNNKTKYPEFKNRGLRNNRLNIKKIGK